jgi:hypothetical protein
VTGFLAYSTIVGIQAHGEATGEMMLPQRKSSVGVTSLHECHFSPTNAASPAGESLSP